MTKSWLREADFHFSPTKPDYVSTCGLEVFRRFKGLNPEMGFAENLGVIVNMKDAYSSVDADYQRWLTENPDNLCFRQAVPRTSALQVAAQLSPVERSYVAKYPGESGVTVRAVAEELINRLDRGQSGGPSQTAAGDRQGQPAASTDSAKAAEPGPAAQAAAAPRQAPPPTPARAAAPGAEATTPPRAVARFAGRASPLRRPARCARRCPASEGGPDAAAAHQAHLDQIRRGRARSTFLCWLRRARCYAAGASARGAPGLAIGVLRGASKASRGGGANEGGIDDGCDGL